LLRHHPSLNPRIHALAHESRQQKSHPPNHDFFEQKKAGKKQYD
jgi:hypothetical protein